MIDEEVFGGLLYNLLYFYEVFKAEVRRRGRLWPGTLGDFLVMCVIDIFRRHGVPFGHLVEINGQKYIQMPEEFIRKYG